jgi:hypothetical protein
MSEPLQESDQTDALWGYDHPAESEAAFRRALTTLDEQTDPTLQQELLREFDALGEQDGYVYEEIAKCLVALERDDEARPYFARAYETLSRDPWLAEAAPARLERLRTLGVVA